MKNKEQTQQKRTQKNKKKTKQNKKNQKVESGVWALWRGMGSTY